LLAWWRSGDKYIDAHTRSNKPRHVHHIINFDGAGSHALGDGGRQSAAGADSSQAVLNNGLTFIYIGENAPSYGIVLVFRENCTLGSRSRNIDGRQVVSGENGAEFDVRFSRYHQRCGRRLHSFRLVLHQANNQKSAC
jgi:hypothetical protein